MKGKKKKRTENDIGPTIHCREVNYPDKPKDRKCETDGSEQKSGDCSRLVSIMDVVGEVAHGFTLTPVSGSFCCGVDLDQRLTGLVPLYVVEGGREAAQSS